MEWVVGGENGVIGEMRTVNIHVKELHARH